MESASASASTSAHMPKAVIVIDENSSFSSFVNWDGDQVQSSPSTSTSFLETTKLTSSLTRRDRLSAVQSSTERPITDSSVAISDPVENFNYYNSQDVPLLLNNSASSTTPLESPASSFSSPSQHGLTNSHPVFNNPQALAAFHGLPQFLPPAPRPVSKRQQQQTPTTFTPDLATLLSNYQNMLKKPTHNSPTMVSSVDPSSIGSGPSDEMAAQAVHETLAASPLFNAKNDRSFDPDSFDSNDGSFSPTSPLFSDIDGSASMFTSPVFDFLTSPFESPSMDSDFLQTPAQDFLTSPLIDFNDHSGGFDGLTFGDEAFNPPVAKAPTVESMPVGDMYIMSPPESEFATPYTPYIDTMSLESPAIDPSNANGARGRPSLSAHRAPSRHSRKSSATGTRKNVTPASLVPFDAPTQPRKYSTPSATSRKEVPAIFAKKRSRSVAFAEADQDEIDELAASEPLPPNATEKEQIAWKRRQNTLAARKSRKRKLEHTVMLEDQVRECQETIRQLEKERDEWKTKAGVYMGLAQRRADEV